MLRVKRSYAYHSVIALLSVAALVLSLGACTTSAEPRPGGPDFQVRYTAAAHRLDGMDPLEQTEQKRDWLRTALAAHLELTTDQLRDQYYDTLPLRDEGFADLARQPVGPGRALLGGDGTLHVLAPAGDAREARTIGLLLDQHRADAGADPAQVRVHRYTDNPGTRTFDIDSAEPKATGDLRSSLGYVEARVDSGQGLTDFLVTARNLSTLEVRGGEVLAGGWTWPDTGAALSHADVSVLHRAYTGGESPAFSLDPSTPTSADLRAALPGLDAALADRVISGDWAGTEFGSADQFLVDISRVLFDNGSLGRLAKYGITADRTQLWALFYAAEGRPFASHARYEGGLAGTEVGMSLFYTDYIAKDWVSGVGDGVPSAAVEGFIPKPEAPTAWSHCADAEAESGRLWFGQNDAAFAFHDGRVDIGAQATRLFTRSDAESGGEVESSYGFGGALRWWDRHYQAVADYEPQYSRLEQLMRWSAALEWLVGTTEHRLRLVEPDDVRTDLSYKDWYAGHDELRERRAVQIVDGADPETLLPQPSETFDNCGGTWIEGGVSLGNVLARKGERAYQADLPGPANRAGLVDESSTVDSTGKGRIKTDVLDDFGKVSDTVVRDLDRTTDGAATVTTTASGRAVSPLGSLKVWLNKTVKRQVGAELSAGGGRVEQSATFHGHDLGGLRAEKSGNTVVVQWRSGFMDRARAVLADIQARLVATPSRTLPEGGDRVLYTYADGSTPVHRVGSPDEPWLAITADLGPPGDGLALRVGAPDPDGSPVHFHGTFTAGPGPPEAWMTVTPGSTATVGFTEVAPTGRPIPVSTRDGVAGAVYPEAGKWSAAVDDPVLGLSGPTEGAALLRDMPRVTAAMDDAVRAQDGLLRVVILGPDGVALVSPDGVRVLSAADPWAAVAREAAGLDPSAVPLLRIADDRLLHVVPDGLRDPGEPYAAPFGEVLRGDDIVFVHDQIRVDQALGEGPVAAEVLPFDATVSVRTVRQAEQATAQPHARIDFGTTWWRVDGSLVTGGETTDEVTTTTPTPTPGAIDDPAPRVLLVCPEDSDELAGCAP